MPLISVIPKDFLRTRCILSSLAFIGLCNLSLAEESFVNPEALVPGLMQVSRSDIEAAGFSTIGDLIRSLPIVSGQSLTSVDAGTSFTPGVSSVNLRGLGNNQGLVLMNGRRMAPYASAGYNGFQTVIDFSSIPLAAMESVEILKEGASGIYGAGATSGVINFNLWTIYEGLETKLGWGDTLDEGSMEWTFSALGGMEAGPLNMVLAVNYRKQEPIFARDVEWTQTANGERFGGFDQRSSANVSANVRGLDPSAYLIDPAGEPWDPANQRFPSGRASLAGLPLEFASDALPGSEVFFNVVDFEDGNKFYDFQESAGLMPRLEDLSLFSHLELSLFQNLEAYLEASYVRRNMEVESAPTPVFFRQNTGASPQGTLLLPADNPYNPFGTDLWDVNWRIQQAGNRIGDLDVNTPRILVGIKGDLPFGNWAFDTAGLYTESKVTDLNRNTVFASQLQDALNGVTIDGELLYANPFGLSDERVIDTISGNDPASDRYKLVTWDFTATGDLLDMGVLGALWAAVGVEYRSEKVQSKRTLANQTTNVVGGVEADNLSGDRDTQAVFAELGIPLTDMMDIQLAGRFEDFGDGNDFLASKIGVNIWPIDGIQLRTAFGRDFHAPDLPYLYSSRVSAFSSQFIFDPLRPQDPPTQIRYVAGGNPELGFEESDSILVGAVIELGSLVPGLDGLSVGIDFWELDQTNVISRLSVSQVVAQAGSPFFDPFIIRLPPGPGERIGPIREVSTQWQNLDSQQTNGIDLTLRYALRTEWAGNFLFKANATWVNSFEFTNSFGNSSEWVGQWAKPRWQANGLLKWNRDKWSAALFVDYVGEYEGLIDNAVKSYWRFNPQVSFSGWYDTTFTVGVRNVFDEAPPVDISDTTTRAIGVHNIEPRFWYVRIKKDW